MTIWHIVNYPSAFRCRKHDLEVLKIASFSIKKISELTTIDNDAKTYYVESHNYFARKLNTRKFWWMRKIKLMSE